MIVMKAQRDRSNEAEGHSLPSAALTYENLRTAATAAIVAAVLTVFALFVPVDWLAFVALWVLLPLCLLMAISDVAIVNRLQYRAYRYIHESSSVVIRHGILIRSETTLSAVQILSIDVVRGPLLRSCGLATVVFRTIGGTIKLGPVAPETADAIRAGVIRCQEELPR